MIGNSVHNLAIKEHYMKQLTGEELGLLVK